jgi:hypothetical protein
LFAQKGAIKLYHFQSFYDLSFQVSSKCCTFGSSIAACVDYSSAELILLFTANNRARQPLAVETLNLKQRKDFVLVESSLFIVYCWFYSASCVSAD